MNIRIHQREGGIMRHSRWILVVVGLLFLTQEALAGVEVFVYPSKGQSKEQQEQDEFGCYKWAKEQTGFDPGAAIGAGVGAAGGAMRRRQAMEQQAAAQEKAKQAYNADVGGYKRAFGACMTGRGYTVS
jgi:hypothetical protein